MKTRFTDYSAMDRRAVRTMDMEQPTEWINMFSVNGAVVYGDTLHETRSFAELYFQMDADEIGIDAVDDPAVVWVGSVAYTGQDEVSQ